MHGRPVCMIMAPFLAFVLFGRHSARYGWGFPPMGLSPSRGCAFSVFAFAPHVWRAVRWRFVRFSRWSSLLPVAAPFLSLLLHRMSGVLSGGVLYAFSDGALSSPWPRLFCLCSCAACLACCPVAFCTLFPMELPPPRGRALYVPVSSGVGRSRRPALGMPVSSTASRSGIAVPRSRMTRPRPEEIRPNGWPSHEKI